MRAPQQEPPPCLAGAYWRSVVVPLEVQFGRNAFVGRIRVVEIRDTFQRRTNKERRG